LEVALLSKENTKDEYLPINILHVIAWLSLVIGIIGAVVIWSTMGDEDIVILFGFASLFGSIITWALLEVICGMAFYLIGIRDSVSNPQ